MRLSSITQVHSLSHQFYFGGIEATSGSRSRNLFSKVPKRWINLLTVAFATWPALLLSGCSTVVLNPSFEESNGTVAVDVANASPGKVTPDIERLSSSMHHFLVGQFSIIEEDYKAALSNFQQASELTDEPAPLLHSKLAELHLRFGHLEDALKAAELSMKEDPNDPYSQLLYAGILEGLGRDSEAEPVYRALIKEFPDKFDSYVLLSNLYLKTKRNEEAIATLTTLLTRAPNEVLGHFYLAHAYEQLDKLELAEGEYKKVVAADPSHLNGAAELLRIYLKLKKIEDAKQLCNQILEKDANNVLARKALGHLLLGESNLDAALEHLQVLEGVEEDASDTRFKIGLIQIEKQNFKEAVRELSLVLAKNPNHAEARYYIASIYAGSGQRSEAAQELLKIKKDSPMFVKSRTFLAFVFRQDKKLLEAKRAIEEALVVVPEDQNLILYLVLVLRDLDKSKEAESVLRSALESAPGNEKLTFNLALVLHDLGRERETLTLMEVVIEKNPANSDALNYVAYALAESGEDLGRAEKLSSQALQLRPNDGYYLDTLGWVQYKKGNLKEAEETISRSLSVTGDDIVIVEHLVEVLIANNNFKRAVSLLKGAVEQKFSDDPTDKEKVESQHRLRQRLDELVRSHPDLATVRPSEPTPLTKDAASQEVGENQGEESQRARQSQAESL